MKGAKSMEYQIDFLWDDEASVWVATSNDVHGLVMESDSFDTLTKRVKDAIPELLALNNLPPITYLNVHSKCRQQVYG